MRAEQKNRVGQFLLGSWLICDCPHPANDQQPVSLLSPFWYQFTFPESHSLVILSECVKLTFDVGNVAAPVTLRNLGGWLLVAGGCFTAVGHTFMADIGYMRALGRPDNNSLAGWLTDRGHLVWLAGRNRYWMRWLCMIMLCNLIGTESNEVQNWGPPSVPVVRWYSRQLVGWRRGARKNWPSVTLTKIYSDTVLIGNTNALLQSVHVYKLIWDRNDNKLINNLIWIGSS